MELLPTSYSLIDTLPGSLCGDGKVERSHRIDDEEFYRMLAGEVIDDAQIFNSKLQEREHFYNFERPHGALAGQTPYGRLRQATRASV